MTEFTILYFMHGGQWEMNGEADKWVSTNRNKSFTLFIRKCEMNVTYNDLVEGICTKIGVDRSKWVTESINAALKKARDYPVLHLFDAILKLLSRWFNNHRNESVGGCSSQHFTPAVEAIMHERSIVGYEVEDLHSAFGIHNVRDKKGRNFVVHLGRRKCTCRVYDVDQIPCSHAMAAIQGRSTKSRDLCSQYYLKGQWTLPYVDAIYPVPYRSNWDIPEDVLHYNVLPPEVKRIRGRRRKKRLPSQGERRPKKKRRAVESLDLIDE